MVVRRGDGHGRVYNLTGTITSGTYVNPSWLGEPDTRLNLAADASGFVVSLPGGSSEQYDPNGRLLNEKSADGRTTTYAYDANGRLESVTGPFGHQLRFTYDANGRVSTLTNPNGQVVSYAYTDTRLTRVTQPDNSARIYHYENASFPNHLTGISLDNGAGQVRRLSTYAYDATGPHPARRYRSHPQRSSASPHATQTTVTDG